MPSFSFAPRDAGTEGHHHIALSLTPGMEAHISPTVPGYRGDGIYSEMRHDNGSAQSGATVTITGQNQCNVDNNVETIQNVCIFRSIVVTISTRT